MTDVDQTITPTSQEFSVEKGWLRHSVGPMLIAAVAVIVLGILVVFSSQSTWHLVGIGRGLVAPQFYPYTGLVIVLATTFGQFVGWATGSALLAYVLRLVTGRTISLRLVQVSMTIVYFGLSILPLFFYHVLFGRPLGGVPQPVLPEWLRQNHPDAYGLIITGHPIVDFSLIPLAIAVLVILWGFGERTLRNPGLQTLLLFLILATSFAVAMSLAIHSTLAHIRISP